MHIYDLSDQPRYAIMPYSGIAYFKYISSIFVVH